MLLGAQVAVMRDFVRVRIVMPMLGGHQRTQAHHDRNEERRRA